MVARGGQGFPVPGRNPAKRDGAGVVLTGVRRAILVSSIVCSTVPVVGWAQTDASGPPFAEEVDAIVRPFVEANDFHGVVAITRGQASPWVGAYGEAVPELDVPHTPDGIFAIGSISKQMTAAVILLLEEEGRLGTADPLRRFHPDFPRGDVVTLRMLLTHTAGVPDIYSLPSFDAGRAADASLDEVVRELATLPFTHEPGTTFAYSNGGYALLAWVIESVEGRPFDEVLRTRLFDPLGMTRTHARGGGRVRPGRVPGYDPSGRTGLAAARVPPDGYLYGSGSVWSSAKDLVRWTRALHGDLLTPASRAKLMPLESGYGYGVSVFTRFGGRVVGHDGRIAGYASDLAHYADEDVTVVLLSNVQSVCRDPLRVAVAAAALGEPVERPEPPVLGDRTPSDAELHALAGLYAFGDALTVTAVVDDGRLLCRANEGTYAELVPMTDDTWFARALYARVGFRTDDTGRVDAMLWYGQGDQAWPGDRLD